MFKKKLLPLYLVSMVNTFGYSILFPLLPFILGEYRVGALFYGIILSVYSFCQFFASPFFGSLSDKVGRRKVLLITQGGTFLSRIVFGLALLMPSTWTFFGIADVLWVMLLARVVDGVTGGNQVVINAYLADVTPDEKRTEMFGFIGAIIGIGVILGPVLGGLSSLGPVGYLGTAIFAAVFSLVAWLALWGLPESLELDKTKKYAMSDLLGWSAIMDNIRSFARDRFLSHLFLVISVFGFVFIGFGTVYLWYGKEFIGLNLWWTSLVGGIIGVLLALFQGVLVKHVSRAIGDIKVIFWGFLLLVIGFGLFIKQPGLFGFIALSVLIALGISFCMPTFKSLLTQNAPAGMQGTLLGIEEAILSFNRVIAPLFAGFFWGIDTIGIFAVFALLCLVPLIVTYALAVRRR